MLKNCFFKFYLRLLGLINSNNYTMKTKFNGILTLFLAFVVQISFAQQKTISGTVSDESGPLPGVSILIKGTTTGTETDFDGKYSIKVATGKVLIFRYLGYKVEERKVGNTLTINVKLTEDSSVLEEIVVVAYGTSSKEALTGSVTQISAESIQDRPLTNFSSALEGASPGVIATAAGGQPGSSQEIRIRGFSSFGASNSPLYVVDGIPTSGNLNNINPNDIESLTILKDASSTALYGNKAANGVVLVTTKSGKNKKPQLSFNYSSGITSRAFPEYDRVNAFQYYPLMWEARRNSQAIPGTATQAQLDAANLNASNGIFNLLGYNPFNVPNDEIVGLDGTLNPNANLLYDDFDWEGAITQIGIRNNANLNYSGGDDKTTYFASFGYTDETGYLINSDFQRFTSRVNVSSKLKDWLKIGTNLAATKSKSNQSNIGGGNSFRNPFRFTRGIGPIYPVFAHDPVTGNFILDENGNKVYDLVDNRPSAASTGRHIVVERQNDIDLDELTTLNLKTFAELKINEDLTFTTNLSYEDQNLYNTFYYNKLIGDGAPSGLAFRQYDRVVRTGFNQLLNYNKKIENHSFDVLLGHESQELRIDNLNGTKIDQIADGNTELINFVTTNDLESISDGETEESYFGRVNYNFDNKYFLSSSIRRDGSSRFAPDNRWGTFWSVGGSWSIQKESFMENSDWVNELKFRTSYGEVGNKQGIGFYASQALFELGNNNGSAPGILRSSLGAPNLVWEKTANYDIALEFKFFNRLRGTVEYYNRKSVDLIFDVPVAPSNGANNDGRLPSKKENIGVLVNQGIEISLSYDIFKSEDFDWNFTVNASTLTNEFEKLPQEEVFDGTKKFVVGKGLFDYWIRDWYGVDPADGSGLFVAEDETLSSVRVIDGVAVTPNSSNAKFHYAGSVIPDLTGSVINNIRYKNFSLSTLFVYQIGGDNLDFNYASLLSPGDFGSALHVDMLNRWQKPGDITDIPRLDQNFDGQWDITSDRFLTDASFLNLRQVTLGYEFNQDVLDKIGISSLDIFLSGENLFSINARKGFNIQQEFSGNTGNVYTPARIITFGLNLKL